MPRYTCVVCRKKASYAAPASHGNFNGVTAAWAASIADNALPGIGPVFCKALAQRAGSKAFLNQSNLKKAWQKTMENAGENSTAVAIQTGAR